MYIDVSHLSRNHAGNNRRTRNTYTMVCPSVCGDNPLTKASGLSPHTDGQTMV